ncbi:MAG: response regulator [Proteobacteria bacterium]|nr:response regulator [Pseudomonadota bacterium]
MTLPYRIALLGLAAFERSTLSTYFRLAANRTPRYEVGPVLDEADFLVADADHEPSVQLVLATEKAHDTVFVGVRRPAEARAWAARPLEPLTVLRELDALVAARARAGVPAPGGAGRTRHAASRPSGVAGAHRAPATAPAPSRGSPPGPELTGFPELPELPELTELPELPELTEPLELVLPALAASAVSAPRAASAPALADEGPVDATAPPDAAARCLAAAPSLPTRALIIDDSEVAQRFLRSRLQAYRLVADCVANSQQALERLRQSAYAFVFVDLELGPASPYDGLGLCRKIKQEFATGASPPQIVVVTAHHGELDRVRATLAGADAFLGKPLDEVALERILVRQGLRHRHAGPVPDA